jgi:hypothetical protein
MIACLAVQDSACATWHLQTSPPAEIPTHGPRIVFYDPGVVGDTLVGLAGPARRFQPVRDSLRMALSDVAGLAPPEFSPGRSLALVGGLVAGTVTVIFVECQSRDCVP